MVGCPFRTWNGESWFFQPLLLLLLFAPQAPVKGAGTVQFGNGKAIEEDAESANAVVAADLDGDGDQDLVVNSFGGGFVTWFENEDGKGTFSEAIEIATNSSGARRTAVGDLDGDGFADIVAPNAEDNQITCYKGLDGGVFSAGNVIETDTPKDVLLHDMDGDGHLDLIFTSDDNDRVAWYQNIDGEGTFEAAQDISTTSGGASRVAAADIDGDGIVDLVVASTNDRVEWFKNSGGVFSLGVELEEEESPAIGAMDLVTADFDGDGNVDVVSASFNGTDNNPLFYLGLLILFKNDGAGSFEEGTVIGSLESARSVAAADLDNDEDLDLVACDYVGGSVVWYENDGQGGFSEAIDIAVDVGVMNVIAVDLDGDGDLDLVSANRENGRVVWYENFLVEATPSPSSVLSPTNPPQAPSSSVDGTTPTPAPVLAPTEAEPTAGTDPNGGSDGGSDSLWVQILIGLVTGVGSVMILGVLKKMYDKSKARLGLGEERDPQQPAQQPAQQPSQQPSQQLAQQPTVVIINQPMNVGRQDRDSNTMQEISID